MRKRGRKVGFVSAVQPLNSHYQMLVTYFLKNERKSFESDLVYDTMLFRVKGNALLLLESDVSLNEFINIWHRD